ncbi:MAG: PorV/PorQ family protein [Elusimicrobia bacterium]|nr:PorV/PorQ family protein [Elusimicrobiota bacterium]
MKRYLYNFLSFIVLFNTSYLFAGGEGTATASFLKIGMSAKNVGMGETDTVNNDIDSIYWNPAGLANLSVKQASFMYTKWIETMGFGNISYAQPTAHGAFAFSSAYFTMGSVDKYNNVMDKVGSYNASDTLVVFSFARSLNKLRIGSNLKYIIDRIDNNSASASAIDLGSQLIIGKCQIETSIQNIGTKIKGDPLPLNFKAGISYLMVFSSDNQFTGALDINKSIDSDARMNIGGEYSAGIVSDMLIALRLGYITGRKELGNSAGLTAGIGFKVGSYVLDYAYVPFGDLGNTHRIGLKYLFAERMVNVKNIKIRDEDKKDKNKIVEQIKVICDELKSAYKEAKSFYRKKWYLKARDKFEWLVSEGEKRYSENELLKNYRFSETPVYEDAIEFINNMDKEMKEFALLTTDINLEKLEYTRGYIYKKDGNYEEAEKSFRRIISINPNNLEVAEYLNKIEEKNRELTNRKIEELRKKGLDDFNAEKYDTAIEYFKEILKLNPEDKEADEYIKKAKAAIRAKENDAEKKKEKEYQKMGKPEKENTDSSVPKKDYKNLADKLYNEGLRKYAEGHLTEAVMKWEQVLRLDPGHEYAKKALKKANEILEKSRTQYK